MGFTNYSNLIMLSDNSDASLEKLMSKLEDFYGKDNRAVKIILDKNVIRLKINNWNLHIGFSNESHVLIESIELADQYAKGKAEYETISKCKARFEMEADPDPNMDFFN